MNRFSITAMTMVVALFSQVALGSIYVADTSYPPELTGWRTTPTSLGVTGQSLWDGSTTDKHGNINNGFKIHWVITEPTSPSDWWSYSYTVSGANDGLLSKGLSHFILEITELDPGETVQDYYRNFSYKVNGLANTNVLMEIDTYEADPDNQTNSNPGLPEDIFGIKMEMPGGDILKFEFSFESEMAPVWGDFYAKDGNNTDPPTAAWNANNDITPALESDGTFDSMGYIARPNGEVINPPPPPQIPEPTSFVIWGLGLLACMAVRFRQRRSVAK